MKYLVTVVAFGASTLFCGCGGGSKMVMSGLGANAPTPSVAGNWEFTATPSATGRAPMTIAGSFTQAGNAVSSALHVNGTSCISRMTTVSLTGSVAHGNLSLTSAAVDGQVVTLNGTIINAAFTGTYKIKGGCGDGDQGNVTGTN